MIHRLNFVQRTGGTIKSLFAGVTTMMLATASMSQANAGDLYRTDVGLELLDSQNSIQVPFTANPNNYQGVSGSIYAPCFCSHFIGDLLLSSYSNLHTTTAANPISSEFTTVVIYNTANGLLERTDSLNLNGQGIEQVSISPVAERPFIVASTFFGSSAAPFGPFGPYVLKIYSYDPTTGLIDRDGFGQPILRSSFDFATMPNFAGNGVLTYNAVSTFSFDGKYMFYTYSVKDPLQPTVPVIAQKFGALAIDENGVIDPTPVAEINMPATNTPTHFFFPQPDIRTFKYPKHSDNYKMILTLGSFRPGTTAAAIFVPPVDSCAASFDFSPSAGTIIQTGNVQLPQFTQGNDFNVHKGLFATLTSTVLDPIDVRIGAPNAFPGAVDNGELQLFSFDRDATENALTFVAGHKLNANGWNLRWSNDGKMIALTETLLRAAPSATTVPVPPPAPVGTMTFATGAGSGTICTYSVKEGGTKWILEDMQPTSPSPINVAWSNDDSMIAVSGQPSPAQRDNQLYKVRDFNLPSAARAMKKKPIAASKQAPKKASKKEKRKGS